jgi:23S rRNA (cytosine1962-C5)-methyltransferase
MSGAVQLAAGKDKPIRQRHPWVFSGAIRDTRGAPAPGDIVDVIDDRGDWLARGYYNPKSQIVVRILTWDQAEAIDGDFWASRLKAAAALRSVLGLYQAESAGGVSPAPETTGYRLAFAESDELPGLIVDRYGDWLSVQFLTLGVDTRRKLLRDLLLDLFKPAGIVDRSDPIARRQEGLRTAGGVVAGREPPPDLTITEAGLRFPVDLLGGQKTGFYLDQRENRRIVARFACARRVLNAFSFTGAFAVHALAHGASHVTNVDTSFEALEGAEEALRMNGFDPDAQAEGIHGDVFQVLRGFREEGRQFDLVILDPPKFARSKAELDGALRGYKDINLLGMRLLAPGGILATFSCSGLVTPDLFQKVVFGAGIDAGRTMRVIGRLTQAPDHPLLLTFPEGEYLKGLLARAT